MSFDIYNPDDIFDSRDVIERIEELRDEWSEATEGDNPDDYSLSEDDWAVGLGEDGAAEMVQLLTLTEYGETMPDWQYGVTLIADEYFVNYAKELAEDLGAIDREAGWPNTHIDWESAAEELKQDYSEIEVNGASYWAQ